MLLHHRPVYIGIAVDIGPQMISSESLSRPLKTALEQNDSQLEERVIAEMANAVRKCQRPVIIVDGSEDHL